MKATLEVSVLKELLDIVGRFVSKHATLPILENVYIKGNIDTLLLKASDMEKYIEVELLASIENEWALTVNAKTFSDIIRTIDDDHVILRIDSSTDTLTIESVGDTFSIKWIAASEFVATPAVQTDTPVAIQTRHFSLGVSKVEYAVTEKNFSPVLTGVFIRTKEYEGSKKLVFVGTDSFRLAEYKVDYQGAADDISFIVPKVHINDIKKVADTMIDRDVDEMQVLHSDNMVNFVFEWEWLKISCMALLIQGNFPDYENENIMPTQHNATIKVERGHLDKAVKKIWILTRDINNYISIEWAEGAIKLDSWKTDRGNANTTVPAIIDGEMVQFGMNGKYVSDFLRTATSDEITMGVVSPEKPVLFQDVDDSQFRYVVRPLIK